MSTLAESTEGVVTVVVETEVESPSGFVSSVVEGVLQEAKKATAKNIKSTFFIMILIFDFFLFLIYILFLFLVLSFFYFFLYFFFIYIFCEVEIKLINNCMRKITDRLELTSCYKKVQNKLEEYISLYKVSIPELHQYVKSNMGEIIVECDLGDVVGASNIVLDVADHFYNSELDLVMKFESFKLRIM